jgi:hypothetical protein
MSDLSQMTPRELQSRAMELEDEVERLREGLGAFADPNNWTTFGEPRSDGSDVWQWDDAQRSVPAAFARKLLEKPNDH